MTREADRDLLLGALAIQNRLVDPSDWSTVVSRWTEHPERDFSDVLQDVCGLSGHDLRQLQSMVDTSCQLHGDLETALAAIDTHHDSAAWTAETLSVMSFDNDPQRAPAAVDFSAATLDGTDEGLQDAAPDAADAAAHDAASGPPASSVNSIYRFPKLRLLAQGGLGEVFVAEDHSLQRTVALKEIRPEYAFDRNSQQRFVLEAEVTGGLEHPGVVPVFGLARYADGRPFYAMRLIQGASMAEYIRSFHAASAGEFSSGDERFRILIQALIDACDAIAYANHRGVVHRDLKPDNIMMGDFGETLVVDWGLAKLNCESVDAAAPTTQKSFVPPSTSHVEEPSIRVTGTPGYMSPEQAEGKNAELGPASDVYSLGATLYCILTGKRSQTSPNMIDALRQTAQGKWTPVLEGNPAAAPALAAICERAMALSPRDRYATAKSLGDDLRAYLNGDVVSAYEEPWAQKAQRWIQNHATAVASACALFIALLMGVASYALMTDIKNRALVQANRREEIAKQTADSNRQLAVRQTKIATNSLAFLVNRVSTSLENTPQSGELRREILSTALEKLQQLTRGYDADELADASTFTALYQTADVVLQFGAGANDVSSSQLALELYTRSLRVADRLLQSSPDDDNSKLDIALAKDRIGNIHARTGDIRSATKLYEEAKSIREEVAQRDPSLHVLDSLSVSHSKLGDMAVAQGNKELAARRYREYHALTKKMADLSPAKETELYYSHFKLGGIYKELRQYEEAEQHFQAGLEAIETRLGISDFQYKAGVLLQHRGQAFYSAGKDQLAVKQFERSLEMFFAVARNDSANAEVRRSLPSTHNGLGRVLRRRQQYDLAMEQFRESTKICREHAKAEPDDIHNQRILAFCLQEQGKTLAAAGDWPNARGKLLESEQLFERISKLDAANDQASEAHYFAMWDLGRLAALAADESELPLALKWHRKALDAAEVAAATGALQSQSQLGWSLNAVADVQQRLQQWAPAIENLKRSILVRLRLVRQIQTTQLAVPAGLEAETCGQLTATVTALAAVYESSASLAESLGPYHKAADSLSEMAKEFPESLPVRRCFAMVLENFARQLQRAEQLDEAMRQLALAKELREGLCESKEDVDYENLYYFFTKRAALFNAMSEGKKARMDFKQSVAALDRMSAPQDASAETRRVLNRSFALHQAASLAIQSSDSNEWQEGLDLSRQAIAVLSSVENPDATTRLNLEEARRSFASSLLDIHERDRNRMELLIECERILASQRQPLEQWDAQKANVAEALQFVQFAYSMARLRLSQERFNDWRQQLIVLSETLDVLEKRGSEPDFAMQQQAFDWYRARIFMARADAAHRRGEFDRAEQYCRDSVEAFKVELKRLDALDEDSQDWLEKSTSFFALSTKSQQDWDILKKMPDSKERSRLFELRGLVDARQGRIEEALRAVALVKATQHKSATHDRAIAVIYSQCIRATDNRTTAKPNATSEKYPTEKWLKTAVEYVKRAVESESRLVVDGDIDLNPIRSTALFREAVSEANAAD